MVESLIARLQEFMRRNELSINQLALRSGIDPANFNKMIAGKQKITDKTLQKIANANNLRLDWLKDGLGEMIADRPDDNQTEYHIPLLDLDASAGFSRVDAVESNNRRSLSLPKCDGAMPIVGQSMEPTIHDGDIAIFDLVHTPSSIRPDGIYIVQYNDESDCCHTTVKRVKRSPKGVGYIRLSSDNADYGDEDIALSSISKVAKVLYTITKLSY